MIQLRVYNGDKQVDLDLFKDEPVFYNLSFAEIQDITKKNSGYSQSFSLPGTKKNNRFFNYFFDTTSKAIDFDSRLKYDASILYKGYELLTGYIRLNDVTKTKGDIVYNATFYNEVGDLVATLADKRLNELVTDGSTGNDVFDCNWDRTNIQNSWNINEATGTTGILDGRILFALLHRGYRYDSINGNLSVNKKANGVFELSGLQDNSVSRNVATYPLPDRNPYTNDAGLINDDYFAPSIQLVSLFKLILNDNGFNLESDFFDNNNWVRRIYLPLTFASEDFGHVRFPNVTWQVTKDTFTLNSVSVNFNYNYSDIISDDDSRWNNTNSFQPVNNQNSFYLFEIEFDYENVGSGQRDMEFDLIEDPNGTPVYSTMFSFNIAGGDSGNFKIQKWMPLFEEGPSVEYGFVVRTTGGSTNSVVFNNFNISQVKSSRAGANLSSRVLQVNTQMGDEIKQIDIISSTLKQFNLIMVPKPNDPKTLIVEPIVNWVGTGELIDWTTKVDRNKPIKITDTTKFINGEMDLKPKDGRDSGSDTYKKENKLSFGQRQEKLDTEFKTKKISVNTEFTIAQQDLIKPTFDYTLPIFYQAKDEDNEGVNTRIFNNFKTTPTLIYYAGRRNINFDRGIYMNYTSSLLLSTDPSLNTEYFPQSHHITYYPVATVTQNKSISFNKDQKQGTYKQIPVHDDCYTLFYEQTLDDFVSDESRFMSCELLLSPEEVKTLDYSEQILIDNDRWRINKLSNVDLRKPSVVKAEFVKIYRTYTPVTDTSGQGDEIQLIACGAGISDIYTTTVLSPAVLSYVTNIVQINNNCYYVSQPTPINPNQTYVSVTLDNNNGTPYEFIDCEACGQTGGNVCANITDIQSIYSGSPPAGAQLLGYYVYEDAGDPQFAECIKTYFYWDCDTNLFYEYEFVGSGFCNEPTGWQSLQGTAMTIPDVGRTGYFIESCCYDPNTGFNYDIYYELGSNGPVMFLHKICCDTQPTTTTTTTVAGEYQYFYIRDCALGYEYPAKMNDGSTVQIGDVFLIDEFYWWYSEDQATIIQNHCFEVIAEGPEGTPNTIYGTTDYVDCEACLGTTTTTTAAPTTTTTTQAPCYYYDITPPTESGEDISVEYIDCSGVTRFITVYWTDNTRRICAQTIVDTIGQGLVENTGLLCTP